MAPRSQVLLLAAFVCASSGDEEPYIIFKKTIVGFEVPTFVVQLPEDASRESSVLVSDSKGQQLQLFSQVDGKMLGAIGHSGQFAYPTGLATIGRDILVAEQFGRGVTKLQRDGTVLGVIGRLSRDNMDTDDDIDSALGLAIGGGLVFVADVVAYRVNVYDETLSRRMFTIDQRNVNEDLKKLANCTPKVYQPRMGFQGPACFNPHGLAWTPAKGGRLFVADQQNSAVLIFNHSGRHVHSIQVKAPRGVTITPAGYLVIAEPQLLHVLTLRGRILQTIKVPGAVNMLGVTATETNLYIADVGAKAVHVVELSEAGSAGALPAQVNPSTSDAGEL